LQFLQEKGFNTPTLVDKGDNYIIMEYIIDNCDDSELRTTLLFKELNKLHSIRDKSFGFNKPIFCGKIKVPNDRVGKWSTLFKNRWKTIIDYLLSKDVTFYNTYCYAMRVYDIMDELLDRYDVYPSLLHGDINPRNFLIRDNKVYFIDPVCFYGDREYDIACYDIWSNYNKKYITSDKKTLYYAFILLLSCSLVSNETSVGVV
jgi:fructosamine-3-kinase